MARSARQVAQAKAFFDRWHLYRHIIERDYMSHRSLYDAVREVFAEARPQALLDLGCGDADGIPTMCAEAGLRAYTGVDLAPDALAHAARTLADASFEVRLVEGDYTAYLAALPDASVPAILAGFTVHHLHAPEKQAFFADAYRVLERPGLLVLYDVVRRPDETREAYFARYFAHWDAHWTDIPAEAVDGAKEHVRTLDHPEPYARWVALAEEAGFAPAPEPHFVDHTGFHCLGVFRKAAD